MLHRSLRYPLHALLLAAASCGRTPPAPLPGSAAHPPQASSPARPQGQLAQVRPPPAPCLPHGKGSAAKLVARADEELDRGRPERALVCAEEALRAAPRSLEALRARAYALGDLDRSAEARLAWARALAAAPADPESLLGAADFFVSREGADHGALELGLEYALRGADAATRRHDPDLAASHLVLAAMAENDLGAARDALAHAEAALAARPGDVDAEYEQGVALYELCRFAEARAALERVLAAAPDDAWTLHELSLVAERMGDARRADDLERRARKLAPDAFPAAVPVDRRAFEAEVRRAVEALPAAEQRALATVPVEVEDVPALDDLVAVDPPLSPSILGLFRGPPEGEACLPEDGERCRSIVFYRKNLVRYARSEGELVEQVRVTLLHELGHLHGESDDDLRARGLE